MITFREFAEQHISEAIIKPWQSEGKSFEEAMSLLEKHAKNGLKGAIQNGGMIYRGFETSPGTEHDFFMMDSSVGLRTSKDTDNLYQLMFSVSTKMKGIPDRSKSFICSTNIANAATYGHVYVMVPFDDTVIAVSRNSDLLNYEIVTPVFEGQLNMLFDISKFLISLGIEPVDGRFTDANKINRILGKFTPEKLILHWDIFVSKRSLKFIVKDKEGNIDREASEKIWKLRDEIYDSKQKLLIHPLSREKDLKILELQIANGNFSILSNNLSNVYKLFESTKKDRFTALASEMMTPSTTGITLKKYGESLKKGVECWFSGKCIAVSLPMFAKILIDFEKQGVTIHASVKKDFESEIKKQEKSQK
jgi:hypothetical protein